MNATYDFCNLCRLADILTGTDGIDMSASNAVVDGWTSWNGDDIINVAPPATNVTMRNIIAYGTHGVSVSCSGGTGGDYLFENALIYDSLIGARFKGVLGTTCNVLNVTWRNFAIFNTSYPVHFIENYVDQETGPPKNANLRLAAFATNFVWDNIVATTAGVLADGSCISDPCWSFTPGESTDKGLYLLCRDQAHCKDFHLSHITLLGAVSKTHSFLDLKFSFYDATTSVCSFANASFRNIGWRPWQDGLHGSRGCDRHGVRLH